MKEGWACWALSRPNVGLSLSWLGKRDDGLGLFVSSEPATSVVHFLGGFLDA